MGHHIAMQLLLLPTRAALDGMQEKNAASDTEPFWLAARSTASVEFCFGRSRELIEKLCPSMGLMKEQQYQDKTQS